MSDRNEQNLEFTRGDDLELVITFEQLEGENEIDVTQWPEILFVVRSTWATTQTDNADAVHVAKRGAGITARDAKSVTLFIPRAVTLTWQKSAYKYDVEFEDAAGRRKTTQGGTIGIGYDAAR